MFEIQPVKNSIRKVVTFNFHYIPGRQRRSRMPYLGQNLDRLGVVRVVPNWDDPPAKKKNEVPQSSTNPLNRLDFV